MKGDTGTATLAGGCFWCTEAVFKRLKGIGSATVGYAGGETESPSYEEVLSGTTGHTESIQLTFDPDIISYEKILDVFFATHDPTTLNRQGADIGTQYHSAIFYHDAQQKKKALEHLKNIQRKFKDPIVTEVLPYSNFFKAENYHADYYEKNRSYPYCQVIIDPKIQKLLKDFKGEIKEQYLKEN